MSLHMLIDVRKHAGRNMLSLKAHNKPISKIVRLDTPSVTTTDSARSSIRRSRTSVRSIKSRDARQS